MRKWVVGVTSAFLLLLPQSGWGGDYERARVGVSTVGNLEISVYAWGPQHVLHSRPGHPERGESATHHLDVRVYDLNRRTYIPYLKVKATISDRTTKREFTVDLVPMIGEWLHYGVNVTLPHHGTYAILIDIQPPDIPRYKHLADVWNTPAQALFTYKYR